MNVFIIKPKLDTRDGQYVKSRALNVKREVDLVVEKEQSIYARFAAHRLMNKKKYDVVLVDEAQFLTREQVDELGVIVDELGIPVMAYGLRTDFNTNAFEGSLRLFEIADKFQEFKTICPCCGKKAIVNMRTDEYGNPVFGGEQIKPGTDYLPVCRKRFKELKRNALLPV